MTEAELVAARATLIAQIVGAMPADHRQFLISFEQGAPDWNLFGVPGAANLPAVRWRQQNLDKLSARKRSVLVERLRKSLTDRS